MSKRLYVTDIIGDGTRTNPYRTAIADITNPHNRATIIDVSRFIGSCGVIIGARSHVPYNPHPQVLALPDSGYSSVYALLDPLGSAARAATLMARGFVFPVSAITFGDVVDSLFRQIEPAFTVNNFDVLDFGAGPAMGAAEPEEVTTPNGKTIWILR